MTLERIFARVVFYIIEVGFKGMAGYFTFLALNEFTGIWLGSVYAGSALLIVLIVVSWESPLVLAEEYEIEEEIE